MNRPSREADCIYEASVKWNSTRPLLTSIHVNLKLEWRKWQLKLISVCFLMLFCLACNSVPENWHNCVNKGRTNLLLTVKTPWATRFAAECLHGLMTSSSTGLAHSKLISLTDQMLSRRAMFQHGGNHMKPIFKWFLFFYLVCPDYEISSFIVFLLFIKKPGCSRHLILKLYSPQINKNNAPI